MSEIESLLVPVLDSLGYALWGVVLQKSGRRSLLRVYIDRAEGIDVEDCANASHQISAVLAVNDLIPGEYTLEVSSPGLDRPLFKPHQYAQFVGQVVKLKLKTPVEKRRNFEGIILRLDEKNVTLACDAAEIVIAFENIDRASIVPDFSEVY